MTYSAEVLADSPLGYWRLGEASGTTLVDSSGNSRDGAYSGSVTVNQTGLLLSDTDKSADFSGGKALITRNDPWTSQSVITAEAWIRADTFGSYNFVFAQDSNGGDGWWLVVKGSKLTGLIQGTEFSGTTTLTTGTTYHIVLTYDGTTAKLYLNGVLEASLTLAANPAAGRDIYIGDWQTVSLPFDGRIDEVAYYATALSGSRIAAHYAAGSVSSSAASGTAALSLSASGTAQAAATGGATLALSASGAARGAATGTAALALAAIGVIDFQPASGSAALALSAAGAAGVGVAGTAALTISGTGTAAGATSASGTAALALSAVGSATLAAAGTASLTFGAIGTAFALFVTDLTNAMNGRRRRGRATAWVDRPAASVPPGRTFGPRYDKAIAYPTPDMVDGRPT